MRNLSPIIISMLKVMFSLLLLWYYHFQIIIYAHFGCALQLLKYDIELDNII